MSDAARLTKQAFAGKPVGTPYSKFALTPVELQSISVQISTAVIDNAYSAIISYTEAMMGIGKGSSSWSVIRLYYSSFYCLRAIMLSNNLVPFNGGIEMVFDISNNKFYKGGRSSHHLNWHSLRQTAMKLNWSCSQDSQDAYDILRSYRENANYTHAFNDPNLHECLVNDNVDLTKRFRIYRDDAEFLYAYLHDHLAIAYPTKLIFEVDSYLKDLGYLLEPERVQHVRSIWKIKDRCPVVCRTG
jgi:hypothetical protein